MKIGFHTKWKPIFTCKDEHQGPVSWKSRKAICKTPTRLLFKAGLFICCKGNKNYGNCKVSCLEAPSFWRYKENYVTRNAPEKFRDFQERRLRTRFEKEAMGNSEMAYSFRLDREISCLIGCVTSFHLGNHTNNSHINTWLIFIPVAAPTRKLESYERAPRLMRETLSLITF